LRWYLYKAAPVSLPAKTLAVLVGPWIRLTGAATSVVLPSCAPGSDSEIGAGHVSGRAWEEGFGSPASSPARVPGGPLRWCHIGWATDKPRCRSIESHSLIRGPGAPADPVIGHARLTGGARLIRAVGAGAVQWTLSPPQGPDEAALEDKKTTARHTRSHVASHVPGRALTSSMRPSLALSPECGPGAARLS